MSLLSLGDITKKTPEEILDDNIQNMLDWSLLNAGAFINITVPTSGVFGGNRHRLGPVVDFSYNNGQVWQTYSKNLVWESGVNNAINISGIHVNNTFIPINSGYYINYPEGRVVFETPINTTDEVEMEYSHKVVTIEKANSIPFFKRLQSDNYLVDVNNFDVGSGSFVPNSDTRVNLPVIGFSTFSRGTEPRALGGYERYLNVTAKFHIISDNEGYCKRLGNILTDNQKMFNLYDSNKVAASGDYPLDYRGSINTGKTYPDLLKLNIDGGYRWAKCDIAQTVGEKVIPLNSDIYMRTITWNTKIVVPGV